MQLNDPAVYMKLRGYPADILIACAICHPLSSCTGRKWRRDHGRLLLHAVPGRDARRAIVEAMKQIYCAMCYGRFVLRRFRSGAHLFCSRLCKAAGNTAPRRMCPRQLAHVSPRART